MSEIASAFVSLLPSAKGFGSKMESQIGGEVKGSASRLGSTFGKMFALAGGALAAAGIGSFLKDSIGEAREAQKVGALTTSVIKATGGAAKVTAKQVGDLATSISLKTGIDDEVIQSGQNMLLTFKNIRNEAGKGNDIFNQTSKTLVDLSAAMGSDPKNAAIQLGKALNDPVKGITALTRVGVTFTEGQKAQIGAMVAAGNTMGAQKIILKELNSEFGGAAAAQATAGEKASVAIGNLKEQIGTALLPLVDKIEMAFVKATPAISAAIAGIGPAFSALQHFIAPAIGQASALFKRLVAAIGPLAQAVGNFVQAHLQPFFALLAGAGGAAVAAIAAALGGSLVTALTALATALASPLVAIGALVGAAVYAYNNFSGFRDVLAQVVAVLQQVAAAVQANFLPVLQTMSQTFTGTILPAITSLASYLAAKLFPVFTQVAGIIQGQVIPIVASLAQFFYGTLYPAVIKIVSAVAQNLKPVFDQLFATIQSTVLPVLSNLLAKFHEYQPTIQAVIAQVVQIVGKLLEFAAKVLGVVLPPVIKFAGFLLSVLVPAIAAVIGVLLTITSKVLGFTSSVLSAMGALPGIVKAPLEATKAAVSATWGGIKSITSASWGGIKSVTSSAWGGIKTGISAAVNAIKQAVTVAWNAIKAVTGVVWTAMKNTILLPIRLAIAGLQGNTGQMKSIMDNAWAYIKSATSRAWGFIKTAVVKGAQAVVAYVKGIPGKIKSALGNLGSLLTNAGKAIVQGLIDGIQSMVKPLTDKLHAITDLIPIHKGPPAKDAVLLRPSGQLIMKGLVDGITDGETPLTKKLADVTEKIRKSLEDQRDKIKGILDGLKSDFASLSDSISSAFTSDMFSAGNAGAFIRDMTKTYLNLGDVKRAFKKLMNWGVDPQFLSQLFASGNSDLILSLAEGSKHRARKADFLFGETNQLANQLGNSVAKDVLGPKIDRTNERLHKIEQHLARLPKNIGKELNGAVAHGQRRTA